MNEKEHTKNILILDLILFNVLKIAMLFQFAIEITIAEIIHIRDFVLILILFR